MNKNRKKKLKIERFLIDCFNLYKMCCSMWFLSISWISTLSKKKKALLFCKIIFKKNRILWFVCDFVKNIGFLFKILVVFKSFMNKLFKRNQFGYQEVILWREVTENVLQRGKKVRRSAVFRRLFSTTKVSFIFHSSFSRSGIYMYLSKGRNENLFQKKKKIFSITKN